MEKHSKIYVAGDRGLVGSAIKRRLEQAGYTNLICRTSAELDLRNQQAVAEFFQAEKLDYAFLAAAKLGGIQ
jgi:GDP-L-fucose synthase